MISSNSAEGVLLGLACGDALGRPLEFTSGDEIDRQHGTVTEMLTDGTHGKPAGTVTDDTELALRIARSLVENERFDNRRGDVDGLRDGPAGDRTGRHRWARIRLQRSGPVRRRRSRRLSRSHQESSGSEAHLDDATVLEKARCAKNSGKFEDPWNCRTAGYESHSEVDMALCCLLAFWTGGDRSQIDRLFHQSGLMREKWDAVHYADGSTYGEKTIERAIGTVDEFYDPTGGTDADASPTDLESQRRRTHLVEENRLLKERVANLETRLAEKNERIEQLEAKLERLGRETDT